MHRNIACACASPIYVELQGVTLHLSAFQTSSSDFCLGISSVHAGAAVSSVCFSPCLCRLVRPGTGDTGGSAVCACCLGNIASAAGASQASVHPCPSSRIVLQWTTIDCMYDGLALSSCSQCHPPFYEKLASAAGSEHYLSACCGVLRCEDLAMTMHTNAMSEGCLSYRPFSWVWSCAACRAQVPKCLNMALSWFLSSLLCKGLL